LGKFFLFKMVKRTAIEISAASVSETLENNGKRGRGVGTTWAQKVAIIEWLEMAPGDNFRLITGSATSKLTGVVAGAKVTKQSAYASLADFVNQRCGSNWDAKTCMDRYRAYVKAFTDTRRAYNNVNGAKYLLGEEDLRKGITTIQQKLHQDCYGYARLDALFGERQNVTPSCIMMTGAPIILNHIEPDRVILAANGDFVDPEGADEDVEEEEGSNSFLSSTETSSDTSTLTSGSAAMPLGAAPIAAAAAPRGEEATVAAAPVPAAAAPAAAAPAVAAPPTGPPATGPPAPTQAPGKKGKKAAGNAIPAALVEAANDSVAAVADGSAPKISLQKKKKDFTSSYAEVKEKELALQERKFEWEKGEAFIAEKQAKDKELDADKENKRIQVEEEKLWRANETSAATERAKIMAASEVRKTFLAALVTSGKSPAEIKEYLAMLEM
jgi:hypothetical protein